MRNLLYKRTTSPKLLPVRIGLPSREHSSTPPLPNKSVVRTCYPSPPPPPYEADTSRFKPPPQLEPWPVSAILHPHLASHPRLRVLKTAAVLRCLGCFLLWSGHSFFFFCSLQQTRRTSGLLSKCQSGMLPLQHPPASTAVISLSEAADSSCQQPSLPRHPQEPVSPGIAKRPDQWYWSHRGPQQRTPVPALQPEQ